MSTSYSLKLTATEWHQPLSGTRGHVMGFKITRVPLLKSESALYHLKLGNIMHYTKLNQLFIIGLPKQLFGPRSEFQLVQLSRQHWFI